MLDPKHTLVSDISSYFKNVETLEDEPSEVLPKVPLAGLRRNTKSSCNHTKVKGRSSKPKARPTCKSDQQPTILAAFTKYQKATEYRKVEHCTVPDNILADFDSSQQSTTEDHLNEVSDTVTDKGDNLRPQIRSTDQEEPKKCSKHGHTTIFSELKSLNKCAMYNYVTCNYYRTLFFSSRPKEVPTIINNR